MGFFDNAASQTQQSGSLAGPVMMAAGALIFAHMMGGQSAAPAAPAPHPAPPPVPQGAQADGGLLGGLGNLIEKFRNAGQGDVIGSWIGAGANKPIDPGALGQTIGKPTLKDIAARAGISEDELLKQLSAALPSMVDKLTPHGRLPTADEIANYGRR